MLLAKEMIYESNGLQGALIIADSQKQVFFHDPTLVMRAFKRFSAQDEGIEPSTLSTNILQ
ncbi:hypothetical protein [Desulfonatronum lacustre]|uniref:hypothetical protein n=1 Tax=Desulfonatronum lacustre TaxID=66849 RepID=UPI00048AEF71|nr:hypothetical protein [Desulfonatronum lacustre]